MKKVIIIGGGAAGLMAAGVSGSRGIETHIYEKNNILGKKIYITGKGRCNITNASDPSDVIENIPGNPYFMYSSLYGFDSFSTIKFFNDLGVETKTERGKRVYPVSDKAESVVMALEKFIHKNNVLVHTDCEVSEILTENNRVLGIRLKSGKEVLASEVIIATGGLSYPNMGSTGDGYKMAKALGHTVTKLYPSLVPLKCKDEICVKLMGLSLKNVAIEFKNNKGKSLYTDFGEMLFTHFGVSGPIILSGSRYLVGHYDEDISLYIDLKPALDEKALDLRILRDFEKNSNKDFKNSLDDLLPQKLIPIIIELSRIPWDKKVNSITKEERKRLLNSIKKLKVSVISPTGYNNAVITSGGISVDEINPSTMESRLISGLFFAGEVIDVDAYTGGYNLQIAFSTGYAAGMNV